MFINFDPDKQAYCDNCGGLGTVMRLLVLRSEQSLNLCAGCFGAMALAFGHAARKLKLGGASAAREAEAAGSSDPPLAN